MSDRWTWLLFWGFMLWLSIVILLSVPPQLHAPAALTVVVAVWRFARYAAVAE